MTLIILDANNIPSDNGTKHLRFDWIEAILTLIVGILTLCLTATIANQQKKIESDKIASEKFFRIEFIEKYQRIAIEKDGNLVLKLKIKELDKDALKSLKITNDLSIVPIEGDKPNLSKEFSVKVNHIESKFEYTSEGMDKDWIENPDKVAFCIARIYIEDINLSKFIKGERYRFDIDIVTTDIFNVEVKCELYPWLLVEKKDNKEVSFSINHNFGYYNSVEYIGPATSSCYNKTN